MHARPCVVMSTSHVDAALSACVVGIGCGVFLSYQVDIHLRDRTLTRVLSAYSEASLPINLIMPPGRMASARVKALKQFFANNIRQILTQ
jgi:DNA-binding transcriptional LysR family regulator